MSASVSIIVPTLNESRSIEILLQQLQFLREDGIEVIVSDGGSIDDTCKKAKKLCDLLIIGEASRSLQMNLGAKNSRKSWLWFVHADTIFLKSPRDIIRSFEKADRSWGFCQICLDGKGWYFRVIEWMMNKRSKASQIGTGDQGIFIHRKKFNELNGFAPIPLMEDIEICKRLKSIESPRILDKFLQTSARRWEKKGVLRTIFLMWALRLGFFFRISPKKLSRFYK